MKFYVSFHSPSLATQWIIRFYNSRKTFANIFENSLVNLSFECCNELGPAPYAIVFPIEINLFKSNLPVKWSTPWTMETYKISLQPLIQYRFTFIKLFLQVIINTNKVIHPALRKFLTEEYKYQHCTSESLTKLLILILILYSQTSYIFQYVTSIF